MTRWHASSTQAYLFGEILPDQDMQHHPALGLLGGEYHPCLHTHEVLVRLRELLQAVPPP